MKQFKAEWQTDKDGSQHTYYTTHHLITQHNALCDYLEERERDHQWVKDDKGNHHHIVLNEKGICVDGTLQTITIKKPEWWDKRFLQDQVVYQEALTACSEASGIKFLLED